MKDKFQVTILGSGTGVPSKKRQAPGIAVQAGAVRLLFDSGSGAAYQLTRAGLKYYDFDHLFYTHFAHPDHINDLPELIFANQYFEPLREKSLFIYGPKGIKKFFKNLITLYPILEKAKYPIKVYELEQDSITLNDITVKTKPLHHQQNACLGYRIEYQGKSLIYSGDTDYCNSIIELAQRGDLLVVECSFPDEYKVAGHLTPGEAGEIANAAKAKKVLLTHLYPLCDEVNVVAQVKEKYDGEVIQAEDLMTLRV